MKLSRKWLNEEFVDLSHVDDQEFLETMTAAGHKLKATHQVDKDTDHNDDSVFEFDIPNNRPDCNSMIGLAREAAAAFHLPVDHHEPTVHGDDTDSIYNWLDVDITAEELCNRYTARMVKNIQITPSPPWLCQRLLNCGIRPVNNIVDISNYVMLESGQPLHIFDYRCFLFGSMVIREAEYGETVTASDGTAYPLQPGMPVIANHCEIIQSAGIPGLGSCEITDETVSIIFGAGNFKSASIQNASHTLAMPCDASGQFATDLDAMMTVPAVQRACELVELLGCGNVLDGIIDVINYVPEPRTLALQPDEINRTLGSCFSEAEIIACLNRLEIPVSDGTVFIPSFRSDLISLSDIAGEIGRLLSNPS